MFIKVIYTAKIGDDRCTLETGTILNTAGELRISFHKDVNWTEPVFVIIEPGEAVDIEKDTEDSPQRSSDDPVEFGEVPLSRVSPPHTRS